MKTAVIGCGRMGRRHIQVVRELGLDLRGICDINRDGLEATAREFGLAETTLFQDVSRLLAHTKPECVIVATTAPTHSAYTCQAAEAGASVILCEKPMAVSLADCDRMIETCRQTGTRLAVNHQMRFMEQYTRPKAIVNSPEFGGLTSIAVIAGNFGMAMNGTHYFEMFRFLTDEEPVGVTAWFSPEKVSNPRGPQFEDRAGAVRSITASGKRFYMEIGADQGHGMCVVYAGRYGRLVVDELAGTLHLAVRASEHRTLPTTRYGMPWVETTEKIRPADAVEPTRAVLNALLRSADYPDGEVGRLAVKTLVAAYVSDESGHCAIPLDASLPRERVFPWC